MKVIKTIIAFLFLIWAPIETIRGNRDLAVIEYMFAFIFIELIAIYDKIGDNK